MFAGKLKIKVVQCNLLHVRGLFNAAKIFIFSHNTQLSYKLCDLGADFRQAIMPSA